MKTIIYLDIDGTVFSGKGIHPYTAEQIKRAVDEGHLVFINTGRSRDIVPREITESLPVSGYVCGLGSYIEYNGKPLHSSVISYNEVIWALNFAIRIKNKITLEGEIDSCRYTLGEKTPHTFDVDSYDEVVSRIESMRVSKFTFARPLDEKELEEASEHFTVYNYPHYSELGQKGYSKASGMRFLSEYFSIPRERSIAMGDSDNDLLMLGEAGIAVAMGNACDKVKAIADFETLSCDDGGVGYAVNKLLFGKEEN